MKMHTPGPWRASFGKDIKTQTHVIEGSIEVWSEFNRVADCYVSKSIGTQEKKANANLIAAAPDLLESLIELQAAYRNAVGLHAHQDDAFTVMSHNAIAKAKGG